MRKELAELGHASLRRRRRWFDGEGSTENGGGGGRKQSKRKERRRRRLGPNNTAQKLKEAALWPSPRQRDAKNGHDRAWNAEEGNAGNVASAVDTVHSIYRNAIHPKFTNYSQIFITTQKSPKTKVVQNQKFYHFAFETIPKFGLHFEMNF